MMCSIMELEDEVTLFLGLTREDVLAMLHIIDSGGAVLPGLDMLELAKATECSRVITNLQLMIHEDVEASTAAIVDIGQMLDLAVQHRGSIHPGGRIVENEDGIDEL